MPSDTVKKLDKTAQEKLIKLYLAQQQKSLLNDKIFRIFYVFLIIIFLIYTPIIVIGLTKEKVNLGEPLWWYKARGMGVTILLWLVVNFLIYYGGKLSIIGKGFTRTISKSC